MINTLKKYLAITIFSSLSLCAFAKKSSPTPLCPHADAIQKFDPAIIYANKSSNGYTAYGNHGEWLITIMLSGTQHSMDVAAQTMHQALMSITETPSATQAGKAAKWTCQYQSDVAEAKIYATKAP